MYATESSTRGGDDGCPIDPTPDQDEAGNTLSTNQRSWTSRVDGDEEGGRGGATTVESPFKDPHQLQPPSVQGLTRLPSFATLTFPLNRNGTPATTTPAPAAQQGEGASASPAGGVANALAGPSQSSPTGAPFSPSTGQFNSTAAQQVAQSSNYGNYYSPMDTNNQASSSSVQDPNLLIDNSGLGPYDQAATADLDLGDLGAAVEVELAAQQELEGSLNPSLKRAREGDDEREGSAGSTGARGSGSPTGGPKPVTTQKTREAGMTRRKVDARFSCPVDGCGSTFTRSHNLSGHLRSHADERPFKCDVCGRGFARQHDCKRHARLHVPEQASSFECQGCNKKFARSDGLAQHQMRTDVGKECLRASGGVPPGGPSGSAAPAPDPNFRMPSPEPWSHIEHEDGPPMTIEEEKTVLEAAILEYVRVYPTTLNESHDAVVTGVLCPFPQGLTPPELLVWISHSPFPDMAKDQEVLRLFGKLIGLPSSTRPKSVLAPEADSYDPTGLVLDGSVMGLEQAGAGEGPTGGEQSAAKQNMRCDFVHPISKQRCPKVFTRSFDMRRHFDSVHNIKITSGHQCEDCEKRFSRSDALGRHKRSYCTKRNSVLDGASFNENDVHNLEHFATSVAHQSQDFPQYQQYQNGSEMDYPDVI